MLEHLWMHQATQPQWWSCTKPGAVKRGILGCNEHGFPLFLMSLLVASVGLSGSLRLRYHGDVMLPISPPTIPPTRITTTSLFPFFSFWFQCFHGDTCLSHLSLLPVSYAALSPWVSLIVRLGLSVCLSVCSWALCALGLPLFAYSLFICFMYVSLSVCLAGFQHPSFPVFALHLNPPFTLSLQLAGCLSGHWAFPPLIPPLLFLLCCSFPMLLLNINSSPLRFSSSFSLPAPLFAPPSDQHPPNVTGNTRH